MTNSSNFFIKALIAFKILLAGVKKKPPRSDVSERGGRLKLEAVNYFTNLVEDTPFAERTFTV